MPSNDDLIILDGCTFFYSGEQGDAEADDADGLFYQDVRHLSRWVLRVDGSRLDPLTSRRVDYYSARIVAKPKDADDDAPPISVKRDRFVTEGAHEDIALENLTDEPQRVRLELAYGTDFADVMEAEAGGNGEGRHWHETSARSVTLWNERDGYRRGTRLSFNRNGRVRADGAAFDVTLGPRKTWSLCVDVTPIVDAKPRPPLLRCGAFHRHAGKMPMELDEWLADAPYLKTDKDAIARTYRQSMLDLAALRVRPDAVTIRWAMPGGGLPWFMTVFGRDSLIAAYEAMPYHQDLAQATLEALSELQATEWDNFRDAEPGKIMHELRRGTLAKTGKIPHTPYYGTHDATLLWLILLEEYERWSGDTAFVRRMEPNARAALGWLEGPADLDGDGYLEYRKRSDSEKALDNHCWKDSDGSIVFADGRKAEPPIATCEIQGYAYDARLRTARLMREAWDDEDTAARLEQDAAELKRRFNRDFWVKARGHYALALDGDKNQCKVRTSNAGHALMAGIARPDRAASVAAGLLEAPLFSGWGIRTVGLGEARYNPMSYHNGSIWPHDNALVAQGLAKYGFNRGVNLVFEGLMRATGYLDHRRIPELFCGFRRRPGRGPTLYPAACSPQAWAAGAPFMLLQSMLGLEFDLGARRIRLINPSVPASVGEITIRNLRLGDASTDFAVRQDGEAISLQVLRTTGDLQVSLDFDSKAAERARPSA